MLMRVLKIKFDYLNYAILQDAALDLGKIIVIWN